MAKSQQEQKQAFLNATGGRSMLPVGERRDYSFSFYTLSNDGQGAAPSSKRQKSPEDRLTELTQLVSTAERGTDRHIGLIQARLRHLSEMGLDGHGRPIHLKLTGEDLVDAQRDDNAPNPFRCDFLS